MRDRPAPAKATPVNKVPIGKGSLPLRDSHNPASPINQVITPYPTAKSGPELKTGLADSLEK